MSLSLWWGQNHAWGQVRAPGLVCLAWHHTSEKGVPFAWKLFKGLTYLQPSPLLLYGLFGYLKVHLLFVFFTVCPGSFSTWKLKGNADAVHGNTKTVAKG